MTRIGWVCGLFAPGVLLLLACELLLHLRCNLSMKLIYAYRVATMTYMVLFGRAVKREEAEATVGEMAETDPLLGNEVRTNPQTSGADVVVC